jgi:hypothetical protein
MSDHGKKSRAGTHVSVNDYGVRPSAGISWMMYVFIGISLVIIFWQGSNVVRSSDDRHVWPAANSVKVDLPASHL